MLMLHISLLFLLKWSTLDVLNKIAYDLHNATHLPSGCSRYEQP